MTDEVVEAGVTAHAQYIKILSGADGATAAVPGDAADGLYVQVRNVSGAISVSAQGAVNWPVSALVRGIVTVVASPQATFFVASSADTNISVSAAGAAAWSVSAQAGAGIPVSADPSATFFVATSVYRNISVSAQGNVNIPTSAVGHVTVSATPAATFFVNTSADRRVYVAPAMGAGSASPVSANGTANPIKYVYINASAAGDLTLVASTANRAIRVIGYAFVCPNSALQVFFQDSQATPIVHAAFAVVTGGGVSYAGAIHAPAFQVSVGLGLELKREVTSDAIVKGHLSYIEVS